MGDVWPGPGFRVEVVAPDREWEVVVERPFVRVGSHPDADVRLSPVTAPPVCLYVQASHEGGYALAVAPLRCGSAIYSGPIRSGTRLNVGLYRLRFHFEADSVPHVSPDETQLRLLHRSSSIIGERPKLTVRREEGTSESAVRIARALTLVGRGGDSKLRLRHRSVSRPHCLLYWDQACLWFVDLFSRAGTWLGDRCLDHGRLEDQQMLQLGELTLTAVYPACHDANVNAAAAVQVDDLMTGMPENAKDALESLSETPRERAGAHSWTEDEAVGEQFDEGLEDPAEMKQPGSDEAAATEALAAEKQVLLFRLAELNELVARQQEEFATVQQRLLQMESNQQQVRQLEVQIAETTAQFQSLVNDREAAQQAVAEMAEELERLKVALEERREATSSDDDETLLEPPALLEDEFLERHADAEQHAVEDRVDSDVVLINLAATGDFDDSSQTPTAERGDDDAVWSDAGNSKAAGDREEDVEEEAANSVWPPASSSSALSPSGDEQPFVGTPEESSDDDLILTDQMPFLLDELEHHSESDPSAAVEPQAREEPGDLLQETNPPKKLLDLEDFTARQKKKKRRWWGG